MAQRLETTLQLEQLEALNKAVDDLSATTPLSVVELLAAQEVAMLSAIEMLAAYMYEVEQRIMRTLGAIPDLGQPSAEEFGQSYGLSYLIEKQARLVSLLQDKQKELQ